MRGLVLLGCLAMGCEGGDGGTDDGPGVTLQFTGAAVTITGEPFGLTDLQDAPVEGFMRYVTNGDDDEPDRPERGVFHGSGKELSLTVGGVVITGSGQATIEVETGGTFRFDDGPDVFVDPYAERYMFVDGNVDPTADMWFSIVGDSLPSDRPPEDFPLTPDDPHTFKVENEGGTMLLQLDTLVQEGASEDSG